MTSMLVLGGTSWLGGAVARAACALDLDVACLARGVSGDAPAGATWVQADRDRPDAYGAVAGTRWDLVVDVSRQPGQVASALAALGSTTSRWTFVSTGSVYADQSGPLTENSPLLAATTSDAVDPEHYGEGKVACERAVLEHPHPFVVRAGLIGGPGDPFDRAAYYAARHALAGSEPVLVPDVPDQPMQVVDVRDLAQWLVIATLEGAEGVVHGVGEPTTVGDLLDRSRQVAGATDEQVRVAPDRLRRLGVQEWMGERSLPLWLPDTHVGMGLMSDERALAAGLVRRPLDDMLVDSLADERARGLDRPRVAGLDRADELDLIARLAATG